MCYGKTRSPLFTTCTVDMSFSTLKRVKTWTRSTKEEYRLDGLCMLSVHRQKVQNDTKFIEKLVSTFGLRKRNLQFCFKILLLFFVV